MDHHGLLQFSDKYPDPKGMIDDLHANHFHLMISVWPYFYPGSDVYTDMDRKGFFIDRTKVKAYHPQGIGSLRRNQPRGAQILLEPDG